MLDSLYIKNFRILRDFKIDSLSQVNLITGKNNTGKSTILEALAIYASRGELSQIYQLLSYRGEDYRQKDNERKRSKEIVENNIRSLSAMFTDRKTTFSNNDRIQIGSLDSMLSLRFVKYIAEKDKDIHGEIIQRNRILTDDEIEANKSSDEIRLEVKLNDIAREWSKLDEEGPSLFNVIINNEKYQFIRTTSIDKEINGRLFDNIVLTDAENYVNEALRIIEPTTERIVFVKANSGERTAEIKLSDIPGRLPIQSMGDGINRILTIILAMVNADNGYLLLDEFENGLHHSVQLQLWKIIFQLAQTLNIQVFVTTHSNDCIYGFEQILNDESNKVSGKLIRLDNINDVIKPIEYSPEEIQIANNNDIEMR